MKQPIDKRCYNKGRPPIPQEMKVVKVGFNLPLSIVEKIKRLAKRGGVTRSVVIYYALEGVKETGAKFVAKVATHRLGVFNGTINEGKKTIQIYGLSPPLRATLRQLIPLTNNQSELLHHAVRLLPEE